MGTDLKGMLDNSGNSTSIEKPRNLLDKICGVMGSLNSEPDKPPTTLDYFSTGLQQAGLKGAAGLALAGALKPASEHDSESLAIGGLLAADPAAAAVGYATVQLAGDHLGPKGMGALKLGAAIAGAAAGGAPLMAVAGALDGGCQLYRAHSLDKPGTGVANSLQPASAPTEPADNYVPTAEEEQDYTAGMSELGWGPR